MGKICRGIEEQEVHDDKGVGRGWKDSKHYFGRIREAKKAPGQVCRRR